MRNKTKIALYHGSKYAIERPVFGYGAKNNDYGLGFYCTESSEIAKEWACTAQYEGYVNQYSLDTDGMRILDLCSPEYCTLNWLAILLENRTFDSSVRILKAREHIISRYMVNYSQYDIIRGYRADDAYFAFVRMFLDNSLCLESLEKSMRLGKLGEQVVMKSRRAFDRIEFVSAEKVDAGIYLKKRAIREKDARDSFDRICKNDQTNGTFLMDILRDDDARVR